jgi:hypothetical protein
LIFYRYIIYKNEPKLIPQDAKTISNRFSTRRKKQWLDDHTMICDRCGKNKMGVYNYQILGSWILLCRYCRSRVLNLLDLLLRAKSDKHRKWIKKQIFSDAPLKT